MIKQIVPSFIKRSIKSRLKRWTYRRWKAEYAGECHDDRMRERQESEKQIPKHDLQPQHIRNLKVLLDRAALLEALPKNGVCAEIGVDRGDFSERILKQTSPRKLHLVDAWGDPSRYHDGLKDFVRSRFKDEIAREQVELNLGFSTDVLGRFDDGYFDWVYLDTAHTYDVTAQELAILKRKIKPHGIIAGHDYIICNWLGDFRYGVMEAVHELCVTENWELLFITINKNEMPSFAIRRI